MCVNDEDNDIDGDGVCADIDPCPIDPDNDLDQDGLRSNVDTDDDGGLLEDWRETNTGVFVDANEAGTDPNNPDTDYDGLDDGEEVLVYGTDPLPEPGVILQIVVGGAGLALLNRRRMQRRRRE
jgi:hypothetical protein